MAASLLNRGSGAGWPVRGGLELGISLFIASPGHRAEYRPFPFSHRPLPPQNYIFVVVSGAGGGGDGHSADALLHCRHQGVLRVQHDGGDCILSRIC